MAVAEIQPTNDVAPQIELYTVLLNLLEPWAAIDVDGNLRLYSEGFAESLGLQPCQANQTPLHVNAVFSSPQTCADLMGVVHDARLGCGERKTIVMPGDDDVAYYEVCATPWNNGDDKPECKRLVQLSFKKLY